MRFISLVLCFMFTVSVLATPSPFNRESNERYISLENRSTLLEGRAAVIETFYPKVFQYNLVDSASTHPTTGVVVLDLGDIPAGSIIDDASLYFNESNVSASGQTLGITCYSATTTYTLITASVFATNAAGSTYVTSSGGSAATSTALPTRQHVAYDCEIRATISSGSSGITGMDCDLRVKYTTPL